LTDVLRLRIVVTFGFGSVLNVRGSHVKFKPVVGSIFAAALLLGAGFSENAQASVVGLFSTGVDPFGVALAGPNGTVDTHYSVISSSSGTILPGSAVTYYNTAYASNNSTSEWISNSPNGYPGNQTITFRTTFTVTDTPTLITALWGADNSGSIILNGVTTVASLPAPGDPTDNFNNLHAVSFLAGIGFDTLDFVITDTGPPLAFRFEVTAVPEPSTWAMMLLGFAGVGFMAYRRKATKPAFRLV